MNRLQFQSSTLLKRRLTRSCALRLDDGFCCVVGVEDLQRWLGDEGIADMDRRIVASHASVYE